MSNISVTENAIYDAKAILEEAGITTVKPKEVYTFTTTSGGEEKGELIFVFNGRIQLGKRTISVKGQDLHRLTMKTKINWVKGLVDPYSDFPRFGYIPYGKVDVTIQGNKMSKVFTIQAYEISDAAYNETQAPTIKATGKLVPGNNKVANVISYKDPEGEVNYISLTVKPGASKTNELSLVFDGVNIGSGVDLFGGEDIGVRKAFCFTPSQLPHLKLHVPSDVTCDDIVKVNVVDMKLKGSSKLASLTVGQ